MKNNSYSLEKDSYRFIRYIFITFFKMSTGVLEGLMCFLISLSCLGVCCQATRGFSCNGEQRFSYNTPQQDNNHQYQQNNTPQGNEPSDVGCVNVSIPNENNQPSDETFPLSDDEPIQVSITSSPRYDITESAITISDLTESEEEQSKDLPILAGIDVIREEIECSICLEQYILSDNLRILPCGHYYHMDCYSKWVCNIRDERCPVCQTIVESNIFDSKKSICIL